MSIQEPDMEMRKLVLSVRVAAHAQVQQDLLAHAEDLAGLYRSAWHELWEDEHMRPDEWRVGGRVFTDIMEGRKHFCVLLLDGRPIAANAIEMREGKVPELCKAAVCREHKGQGLGRQVTEDRLRLMEALDIKLAVSWANGENSRSAQNLCWMGCAFAGIGVRNYQLKHGRVSTLLYTFGAIPDLQRLLQARPTTEGALPSALMPQPDGSWKVVEYVREPDHRPGLPHVLFVEELPAEPAVFDDQIRIKDRATYELVCAILRQAT